MLKINGMMIAAAFGVMLTAPQADAGNEVTIYPYASSHNFCPAGLQPVSISGTICCGVPNTHVSYQSAKAHPVQTHRVTHNPVHRATNSCPVGTKGCTFD
jgi:hypothetical protein